MGSINGASLAAQAVNSGGGTSAGAVTNGGPNNQDQTGKATTDPKFGDLLNQIQSKYGAKTEKPREIKKTLGKDDFMRIMITQMRHQDPTNPFKAEQMATEMAQFASLEQLSNVNQNLGKMQAQTHAADRLAATGLIGRTVTIDRDRFPHTQGENESVSFSLPKDAKSVKIALVSETGETVLEKDLGEHKMGEGTFAWDGLKANRLPAGNGNYMFRVEAKDENDHDIQINSQRQARVIGVSFEGGEPVFLVGDARQQDKVTMKNIIRIDGDVQPSAPGGAAAGAGGVAGAAPLPPKGPNLIAFQKGVGSSNLDPNALPPEARAVIERMQDANKQEQANDDGAEALKAQEATAAMFAQEARKAQDAKAATLEGSPLVGQRMPQGSAGGMSAQQMAANKIAQQQIIDGARRGGPGALPEERGFPNGLHDDSNSATIQKGGEKK